jgi:hypothetical protein
MASNKIKQRLATAEPYINRSSSAEPRGGGGSGWLHFFKEFEYLVQI